jgi:hypothetical protein
MHLKTTVSYVHALELVPDLHKTFIFTMIITFDASAIGFASAVFYFYEPNLQVMLNIHFYSAVVFLVVHAFLIPESPRWLF